MRMSIGRILRVSGFSGSFCALKEDAFKLKRVVTPSVFALPVIETLTNNLKGGRFRQVR